MFDIPSFRRGQSGQSSSGTPASNQGTGCKTYTGLTPNAGQSPGTQLPVAPEGAGRQFGKHPLTSVAFGFLLTVPLGGAVAYMYSRIQNSQDLAQKEADYKQLVIETYMNTAGIYAATAQDMGDALQSAEPPPHLAQLYSKYVDSHIQFTAAVNRLMFLENESLLTELDEDSPANRDIPNVYPCLASSCR